ncbi:hypothetical protein LTR85_004505 [Meristemomyces frigidus]|nr:hypothetical protein LTR85_004505 [Meristemomyces frigidus]
MPVQWTADLDRRLLLPPLELAKVDNKAIAELWAKKYGNEGGEQPTPRAITERLVKLKKSVTGGSGGTASTGTPRKSTAVTPKATPKKPTFPKTPTSSAKRNHKAMSDEDDSEIERMPSVSESTKRAKLDRRSKTPKIYEDPGSEHEAADDEAEATAGSFGGLGHGIGSIFDQELTLDGVAEKFDGSAPRRKIRKVVMWTL